MAGDAACCGTPCGVAMQRAGDVEIAHVMVSTRRS